jgi:hypothetical protein
MQQVSGAFTLICYVFSVIHLIIALIYIVVNMRASAGSPTFAPTVLRGVMSGGVYSLFSVLFWSIGFHAAAVAHYSANGGADDALKLAASWALSFVGMFILLAVVVVVKAKLFGGAMNLKTEGTNINVAVMTNLAVVATPGYPAAYPAAGVAQPVGGPANMYVAQPYGQQQQQYAAQPYGQQQQQYAAQPYGQQQQQQQYAAQPYGQQQQPQQQYAAQPYGQQQQQQQPPHAAQPYAAQPYAAQPEGEQTQDAPMFSGPSS